MKNQALSSLKDQSEKLKCCLLRFLFGPLRVTSYSTKKQTKKIYVRQSQKKICPMKIREREGKQCRSRRGDSFCAATFV